MVQVPQTTQNLVISRCCFVEDGKEMYKNYNARAQPFYCLLNLLSSDVLVAVAVVVFLNSLITINESDVIKSGSPIMPNQRSGFQAVLVLIL